MKAQQTILYTRDLTKSFPGVIPVNKVNFSLGGQEVHALVGENGAGKSTFLKILAGNYRDYVGDIFLDGYCRRLTTPRRAIKERISIIFQDLSLINHMTVTENLFLGIEPLLPISGVLNKRSMRSQAINLLAQYGLDADTQTKISDLSLAEAQLIEIIKALMKKPIILAMDEPTSLLTQREVKNLHKVIESLRSRGMSIIYVTHRLEEVFEICDKVSVMKDGRLIMTKDVSEIDMMELKHQIGWMDTFKTSSRPNISVTDSRELLRFEKVSTTRLNSISFSLKEGESMGVTGKVASGKSRLAKTIFGIEQTTSGKVFVDNLEVRVRNPHHAIKMGIGLLTEDRKNQGLIPTMSVWENIVISIMKAKSKLFFYEQRYLKNVSFGFVEPLNIKTPSIEEPVQYLSGGNQQKVLIARWLCADSRILIFDEPTRGIDVSSKSEIYSIIDSLREEGKAVIIISSEIDEIMRLCDQIMVLRDGKVALMASADNITKTNLLDTLLS